MLFERRQLGDYRFAISGEQYLGSDPVVIVHYKQLLGSSALTVFEGRKAVKVPLEGDLWVRIADSVPLRVTTRTVIESGKSTTEYRSVVDYYRSAFGVVLPASVRYEKLINENVVIENLATYSDFHLFSASTEIEFQPPVPAPKARR